MKKFTFYLPEQQMEKTRKLSKQTGLSVSELLRRAIDDLLAKYEFTSLETKLCT